MRRLGLVVHPSRDVSGPRDVLMAWAGTHGVEVVALGRRAPGHDDAPDGEAGDCDAIVAIGGDGTVLGGVRHAAPHDLPVLGVACGSLGILAGIRGGDLENALDRVAAGDWVRRPLSGLHVSDETGGRAIALNDLVVVRRGSGQLKAEVVVDGERYVRTAGDGVVVSTVVGSSAYNMAAGGPILAPGLEALVVTPLAMHGGSAPPLVVPASCPLELRLDHGFGGRRIEIDGQPTELAGHVLDLVLRPGHVTLVAFEDQEPVLTGLRRRSIVVDSPRIVAHDARIARERGDAG